MPVIESREETEARGLCSRRTLGSRDPAADVNGDDTVDVPDLVTVILNQGICS